MCTAVALQKPYKIFRIVRPCWRCSIWVPPVDHVDVNILLKQNVTLLTNLSLIFHISTLGQLAEY